MAEQRDQGSSDADGQNKKSILPTIGKPPESSRDPLSFIVEIVKDPDISDNDKATLIQYSRERFRNRRIMAYVSLFAIVTSFILIFVAAIIDGLFETKILQAIDQNSGLFGTIEGLLAAIVAAYYGVSAWRPSS